MKFSSVFFYFCLMFVFPQPKSCNSQTSILSFILRPNLVSVPTESFYENIPYMIYSNVNSSYDFHNTISRDLCQGTCPVNFGGKHLNISYQPKISKPMFECPVIFHLKFFVVFLKCLSLPFPMQNKMPP